MNEQDYPDTGEIDMGLVKDLKLPPPDTHCLDDEGGRPINVWSYSPELVRQIIAADRALREQAQPLNEVWMVSNKVSAMYFATEEMANKVAHSGGASTAMDVTKINIIGASLPERKPDPLVPRGWRGSMNEKGKP